MNPRYFHELLGQRIGPSIDERSRGGELNVPWDLLKWNVSVFKYSMLSPNLMRSLDNTL